METFSLPDTVTMTSTDVARFLRLLADESRQAIVRLLARSDRRASEIGAAVRLHPNAVSYHLRQLRDLGMLHDRRSSADARDVYYQLDIGRLFALYAAAGDALYPGMSTPLGQLHKQLDTPHSLSRPLRVLASSRTCAALRPLRRAHSGRIARRPRRTALPPARPTPRRNPPGIAPATLPEVPRRTRSRLRCGVA